MKKEERLSAIEIALKNEKTEREFYLKNAERTKNPLGKAMFKQIADDELEHYERLKDLTRGKERIGAAEIRAFIDGLDVGEDVKDRMRALTPHNYTGIDLIARG